MKKILLACAALAAFVFGLGGCSKKANGKSIAVFVPGIIDDSPTYEKLTRGVTKAVEDFNQSASDAEKITLFVMEAGTNQAEWSSKITALAAEQKYDVIISSNPSLPDLVEPIINQFPKQKFILLDATREGNDNIYTVCYDQSQQGFLAGYVGGLMSKTGRLALIAAQEYPVMNEIIYPSFVKGAVAARSDASVDFRVVGNWYDATKGAEIADAVAKNGVDVILPICGGASQGVISSAVNNGIYISWFDDSGFKRAPGTIIGSSTVKQAEMAEIVTKQFIENKVNWGKADMVGMQDGFIEFVQDDPLYISAVPQDVRDKMAALVADIVAGK
jgi:simple sugar transport system substrate-binding protein